MLTKTNIEHEKLRVDSPFFKDALAPTRDESTLLFLLNNLGKLPAGDMPFLMTCTRALLT